ncbi:MAG: hypothetical protein WCD85_18690 [Pantoea agglomerans]
MAGIFGRLATGMPVKRVAAVVLAAVIVVGVVSCGGGSSSAPPTGEGGASSTEQQAGGGEQSSEQSGGESVPGGNGDPRSFGEEADSAEREAALQAVEGFMKARAAGDWAVECSYAAREVIQQIEEFFANNPQMKGKSCGVLLAGLSEAQPKKTLRNNLGDSIDSLRVEGTKGFAIYHGTDGGEYAIPMALEDGDWKVAYLAPTKLPPAE